MKHIWSVRLVLAALVIVLPALTIITAQPKGRPKPLVAVMSFKADSTTNKLIDDELDLPVRTLWAEELKKSGKVRVLSHKQVDARLKAQSLVWEYTLDVVRAKEFGKALGVKYLLTGYINDQLDPTKRTHTLTMKASLIDTSTGEIVWADEASTEESSVPDAGPVSGNDVKSRALAEHRFKVMLKPCVEKLSAKLTAATLPGLL